MKSLEQHIKTTNILVLCNYVYLHKFETDANSPWSSISQEAKFKKQLFLIHIGFD